MPIDHSEILNVTICMRYIIINDCYPEQTCEFMLAWYVREQALRINGQSSYDDIA